MLNKFIGDRKFYKMVFAVAIPMIIQNTITNFVSLLDNIMVGRLGTEQMSGVSIVNTLMFVFNLCIFGLVSGAGIFAAQFHGKKDDEGVRQAFRFKIIASFFLSAIAIAVFVLFNDPLIRLYLSEGSDGDLALTLQYGKEYIWISVLGLLPFAISMAISSTLREIENAVLPMIAGFCAVGVNCVGNYILIFGHFGAPELGVRGAAIATVMSRFVELGILIIFVITNRSRYGSLTGVVSHLFKIDRELVHNILIKGTPLFLNETLWAVGISALTQCYSTRGLDVVAGHNIGMTFVNLFNIAYMALGSAVGIVVGKYLGAGDFEGAKDVDRKMIALAVVVGVIMGAALFSTAGLFPQFYNTTGEAKTLATQMMQVAACAMPLNSFLHACYFTIRSGGKTVITFLYDSVYVCCINFPIILALTHLTLIPYIALYIASCSIDVIKCVAGFVMVKRGMWINRIV